MSETDPRHGSTRGFAAGCRCTPCREARNADERSRRKYREVLGIHRLVDGTGTVRRIRSLWAIGWTSAHIAERCGWSTPQAVTELVQPGSERRGVYRATAETVARTYDQLSMTPGPSATNRKRAERNGWPPPAAWLDIDDPDERPDPGYRPVRQRPPGELIAEWAHLRSLGVSIHQAAKQLGVSVKGIEKASERTKGSAA